MRSKIDDHSSLWSFSPDSTSMWGSFVCRMVFVATGRSNGTQCVTPLPTQVYHDVTLSTALVISDVGRSLTLRRFVLFISMLQFLLAFGNHSRRTIIFHCISLCLVAPDSMKT